MNYNCENICIVRYPRYAGGKFIIVCLGLSAGSVLQDQTYARLDLDGILSSKDKFELVKLRLLQESKENWQDFLGLGDFALFNHRKAGNSTEFDLSKLSNEVIELTNCSTKKFFISAHSNGETKSCYKFFPNAKMLKFVNYAPIILERRGVAGLHTKQTLVLWNLVKKAHWTDIPPIDHEKFVVLPEYHELLTQYPAICKKIETDITQYHRQYTDRSGNVIWDCNNFLNKEKFLDGVRDLYGYFDFNDFDLVKNYISELYVIWSNINLNLRN